MKHPYCFVMLVSLKSLFSSGFDIRKYIFQQKHFWNCHLSWVDVFVQNSIYENKEQDVWLERKKYVVCGRKYTLLHLPQHNSGSVIILPTLQKKKN